MTTQTAIKNYKAFSNDLKGAFLERDIEIDILLTAMIAKKSAVFVGEPGTAKSLLLRVIAQGLSKNYFECQLNPYTVPDDIIGHFSLKELKENDRRVRKTKGKIADSVIAYLDEVFSGNRGTQQSIQKIMNEKVVEIGEGVEKAIPLELLVGASNQYPTDTRLAAAWDRWIFRRHVSNNLSDKSFERLLLDHASIGKINKSVTLKDIAKIRSLSDNVDIKPVIEDLFEIRGYLKFKGIEISNRRWVHVADIIRSRSAMDGRDVAEQKDLKILSEVLWIKPEDRSDVASKIAELVAGELMKAMKIEQAAREAYDVVVNTTDIKLIGKKNREIKKMLQELEELHASDSEIEPILNRVQDLKKAIATKIMEAV